MRASAFALAACVFGMCGGAGSAQTPPAAGDARPQSPQVSVEEILPSAADPAVRNGDAANLVVTAPNVAPNAPLAVFLPGTNGDPERARLILSVIAQQGYRAIGLMYDDDRAGDRLCTRRAPPDCLARFREMAIDGRGPAPNDVPAAETIDARLTSLLAYLDRKEPGRGWGSYLTPQGALQYDRILFSGLSQGAGMAAFIAKQHAVYRVVLFSSPWDWTGRARRPVPWLFAPSATPLDRWWAERAVHENTTLQLANAYRALQIPPDHVLLFDAPLMNGAEGENPYHGQTIRNPAFEDQWRTMFGTPAQPPPS